MPSLLRGHSGMNIVGQGGKIILFTLPALFAAMLVHGYLPRWAALPLTIPLARPVGYLLLISGIVLWASAVVQLMLGFSRGRLVTTGAYAIVRNPIYSSVTFFVLPAVSLLTSTWVYLAVSPVLYLGVALLIGPEERQLRAAFGEPYGQYQARVHRMIPLAAAISRRPGAQPSMTAGLGAGENTAAR